VLRRTNHPPISILNKIDNIYQADTLLSPIFTMMTKLSIMVKAVVSFMVVAALVAASWESSKQQPESSKRSLHVRVGKERKLQSLFPDFSAFGVPPSFSASSFNPSTLSSPTTGGGNTGGFFGAGGLFGPANGGNSGTMSGDSAASGNGDNSGMMSTSPMGDNTEGGVASGFGDIFLTTAGGSGGGVAQSSGGGSIKPVSVGGVNQFQITAFNGTSGSFSSGFGSGVVGPAVTSAFTGFSPSP
jgi:hypothetical protein